MVYSLPGSYPKRMVLVRVCDEHRAKLVRIERLLSTKYMPFAYVQDAVREICSLGEDYSNAYGYAQEHHTLELWLRIWVEYNKDLVEHGTPTSCKRIIDVATCLWNKCMGNVDTVRRVVTMARAKRGKGSAPGSLYWFHLLDYILYQAFRVHQHSSIEGNMDSIETQKRFQSERKRGRTYRGYLYKFVNGLTAPKMNRYFPGLQARIDHMQPESITTLSSHELNEATGAVQPRNDNDTRSSVPEGYNMLKSFLDPRSDFYAKRLNSSLPHYATQSTETQSAGKDKGERKKRCRCILCCSICDERAKEPKTSSHSRDGRRTVDYCFTCKVYLCKDCFGVFHKNTHPTLPPCCSGSGILTRSRKRPQGSTSISSPVRSSPKTSTRKRRARATSSPRARGTISAQLRGRTKNPSETSPTQSSPSPKGRKRTAEVLEKSSDRRVQPRVLYSPTKGSDVSSPPKVSRSKQAGWRAILSWPSKR
mmetsp:Transcript_19583/g.33127  ORF Transcript_19583/g.33127 Transcript_19583/m.33127 type:complete len:478 (-) Transcript_19583:194-1627(-)